MTVQIKDSDGTVRLSGDLLATGGATGDVLTQQADGTYAPASGGPDILLATTELSSAQLLDLHNTRVAVTPTPAAGKAIMVLQVWTALHFGGVAYTGAVTGTVEANNGYNNFTAATGSWVVRGYDCQCWWDASGSYATSQQEYDHADLAGSPWYIMLSNAIAAGNGTVTVYCVYVEFDV